MNLKIINIFLIWLFLLVFCTNAQGSENWSVTLNTLLKNCIMPSNNSKNKNQAFIHNLRSCLQKRALNVINTFFSQKVIRVLNGIDLVKFKDMVNFTTDVKRDKNQSYSFAKNINDKTWLGIVFQRLTVLFNTHMLKIDVERLVNQFDSARRSGEKLENNFKENRIIEGRRHHRRRHNLMPMMMMGLLIMGSVLIPMGFQFLAVLGGKALILAKMALILSSIQGLKRIATSGVNYGPYAP